MTPYALALKGYSLFPVNHLPDAKGNRIPLVRWLEASTADKAKS